MSFVIWLASLAWGSFEVEKLSNGMTLAVWPHSDRPTLEMSLNLHSEDQRGTELLSFLLEKRLQRSPLISTKIVEMAKGQLKLSVRGFPSDALFFFYLLADQLDDFSLAQWEDESPLWASKLKELESRPDWRLDQAFHEMMGESVSQAFQPPAKTSLKDVNRLYQAWRDPSQMVFVVNGLISQKQLEDLRLEMPKKITIAKAFPVGKARPEKTGKECVFVEEKFPNPAHVRLGARFLSPIKTHALMLANTILGGYFKSRLNHSVRDELGLTYSIKSSLLFLGTHTEWVIAGSTRSENLKSSGEAILRAIARLQKDLPTEEELKSAQIYLEGIFSLGREHSHGWMNQWVDGVRLGFGFDHLDTFSSNLKQVTLPELHGLIRSLMPSLHWKKAFLGERASWKGSLGSCVVLSKPKH